MNEKRDAIPVLDGDLTTMFLPEETLRAVTPVLISMLSWHRQAWQGMIHRFDGRRAFFTSADAAMAEAERHRVQGSYFEVHEVPALRLDSVGRSIVVLNHREEDSMSSWASRPHDVERDELRPGAGYFLAVYRFQSRQCWPPGAARLGVILLDLTSETSTTRIAFEEPRGWRSSPNGPGGLLWEPENRSAFKISGVKALARLFAKADATELRKLP